MYKRTGFIFISLLFISLSLFSQDINQLKTRMSGLNSASKNKNKDSLVHRNPNEDSITISYRFFDSTRVRKIDSSISDWYSRFPVPASYDYLSNLGEAAHSLLFTADMHPGFDAGFHSFDIYKYTLAGTRFFSNHPALYRTGLHDW